MTLFNIDVDWAVPWISGDVLDFLCLLLATIIVTAVPLVYGFKANLRDPLARAVLAGTTATAVAFIATTAFTLAFHMGWQPTVNETHWIARMLYLAVAFGKAMLLIGLLRVLRVSRNRRVTDESASR